MCHCHTFCLVILFFFQFGELEGFTAIQAKLNTDEIEIAVSSQTFIFVLGLTTGLICLWGDEIIPTQEVD